MFSPHILTFPSTITIGLKTSRQYPEVYRTVSGISDSRYSSPSLILPHSPLCITVWYNRNDLQYQFFTWNYVILTGNISDISHDRYRQCVRDSTPIGWFCDPCLQERHSMSPAHWRINFWAIICRRFGFICVIRIAHSSCVVGFGSNARTTGK